MIMSDKKKLIVQTLITNDREKNVTYGTVLYWHRPKKKFNPFLLRNVKM